jgi:cholesterol transport system auxiliary component
MTLRFSRFVVTAVAASAALLLAGCGGLKSSAAPEQRYVLRPALARAEGPRVDATLQLLRPVAQPGLDTARIALVQPGNRLDYYAGGSWAGPLADVAESLFAQTLRSSGRFAQVASDAAGMGADFVLAVTLRRFEAEYAAAGDAPPRVRLRLECTLSSRREHRQIAGFDIEAEADAGANRLGSVVAAMESAAQDAARQLVARSATLAAQALVDEKADQKAAATRK